MDDPPIARSKLQSKKISEHRSTTSKPGSEPSKSASKIGALVMKAIKALKEPDGCGLAQIKKYMSSKLNINTAAETPKIKNYLKKAMAIGILSQEKGKFKVERRRRRKSKSKGRKKSGSRRRRRTSKSKGRKKSGSRRRNRKGGKKKAKKGGKEKERSRKKKGGKKKGKAKKGKGRRSGKRGPR